MPVTYSYSIYGLTMRVPFHCPALPTVDAADDTPDATVAYGQVPPELKNALAADDSGKIGYRWQAAPGHFLLKGGQKSGRFLVEGGTRITMQRNSSSQDEWLLFHLFHPVTAALCRQRGLLVLHACAAEKAGDAFVFCGSSGAGKSTTLAAILNYGYTMISDDITILRFGSEGRVEVLPGPSRVHLWDEAALSLGLNVLTSGRHPTRRGKVALLADCKPCNVPANLRKLYVVEPGADRDICVCQLRGKDKLGALMECIYGPLFQEEHPGMFSLVSVALNQADIFRIRRPEGRWTVDETIEAILNG